MSGFCRCCVSSSNNSTVELKHYSLFKNVGEHPHCEEFINFDVIQALFECAHVKIYENDGLSSLICSLCLAKLEVCVKFREQFINSELKQRKLLNDKHVFPLIVYEPVLIEDGTTGREVVETCKGQETIRKDDLTDKDEVTIIEESNKTTEQLNSKVSVIRSLNNGIEETIDRVAKGDCTINNNDSIKSNCRKKTKFSIESNYRKEMKFSNESNSRKKTKLSIQSSFRCDTCFEQFVFLSSLSDHKKRCAKKKNPTHDSCQKCLRELKYYSSVMCAHNNKRGVPLDSGLVCALCPSPRMVFETIDAVNAHIKFHHAPGVDFTTVTVVDENQQERQ